MDKHARCDACRAGSGTGRRDALKLMVGGVIFGLITPEVLTASGESPGGADNGEKVRVGRLVDLPPGKATMSTVRQLPVLVLNHKGRVKAFSAICTHEGCHVGWSEAGGYIQCPCHDGRYDTDGKVISGPPPAPLPPISVRIEDGMIYLIPSTPPSGAKRARPGAPQRSSS